MSKSKSKKKDNQKSPAKLSYEPPAITNPFTLDNSETLPVSGLTNCSAGTSATGDCSTGTLPQTGSCVSGSDPEATCNAGSTLGDCVSGYSPSTPLSKCGAGTAAGGGCIPGTLA